MPDLLILAPILAPLSAAFLIPFVALFSKRMLPLVCLMAMTVSLGALLVASGAIFRNGEILVYWMGGWKPLEGLAIGINLVFDAWGLLVAITIALVAFLVVLYSIFYMEHETGKEAYYILVMLLTTALIGFTLTGDLFNQFVWLEILSFSAFALTAHHYNEGIAVEGAFKYLVTNSVAALFIVIGLALLYATTGVLNLADAAGEFGKSSAEMIALGLLFAGYATKSALVPWHFWLPDAHQVAPTPVSALLSGALINIGIYAIGRLLFTLTPPAFNFVVEFIFLGVAGISMFVGGFQMMRQDSIKRILAYSSISQMGYILFGLAIGTPLALAGAALHIFNHAMAKTALFFAAGAIQHQSGVRLLSEGGGLLRRMPGTFVLMTLAGLSLSGMPLFIGFVSKTMLEESAIESNVIWIAAIAVLSSGFTFAGLTRLLWRVFIRKSAAADHSRFGDASPVALLGMLIPVSLSILIGIFPQPLLIGAAWPSAAALLQPGTYVQSILDLEDQPEDVEFEIEPFHGFTLQELWIPGLVVLLGSGLAYFSLPGRDKQFWNFLPLRVIDRLLYRWHSGYLPDYVLWNTFSTTILLILIVLFYFQVL